MPNPVTTATIATANVNVMAAPDNPTTASRRSASLKGLMMCANTPAPSISKPSRPIAIPAGRNTTDTMSAAPITVSARPAMMAIAWPVAIRPPPVNSGDE